MDPLLGRSTRREFLRSTAAAGCGLTLPGLLSAALAAQTRTASAAQGAAVLGRPAAGAPLMVVTQTLSTDVNPRTRAWGFITEVLQRAGLFFDRMPPAKLGSLARRPNGVVLLAGHLPLTAAQRQALTAWVNRGGALIGIGGTSGLEEVFGVSGASPLADGWLKITAANHPVLAGLRSSLHVFGGYTAKKAAASALAEVETGTGLARGSAIFENQFGKGRALLLGPDVIFSIVHIQQGIRVLQDGKPAPDGSAAINEGMLKAEDGLVLDWQRDRQPVQPDNGPIFLEPVSDELRELVLRSIFHLASQQGLSLPVLWYWPRSLKAVAMLSHDSDGNEPPKAPAMLEVVNRCNIKSTWCILYPGGYPRDFYHTLQDQGFEVALHYDAMTGKPQTSWSKENFLLQQRWLLKEAGLKHLFSSKNHYTRWEGRLDFWRWMEEAGIESDETRGPSKKGTIGFPLGGSQPYFPLDDEAEAPRFFNVLEVNLLTQDHVVTCPPEYGKQLVDSVLRHHGVGHFLFHPAHILKPGVANALTGLVDYARAQGLEWWTNRQIRQWEDLRREVQAKFDAAGTLTLRVPQPLSQATLLLLKPQSASRRVTLNGQAVQCAAWTWHGFEFDAVTQDLAGEVTLRVARS